MSKLNQIAKGVEQAADGIYYTSGNRKVSYPEDGNSISFELEKDSFWFKHRNEVLLAAINFENQKKDFYDIGGGNGFVSLFLQNKGFNVTLIEPGIQGAQAAKKRGLNQVICSTLEEADFKEGSFESAGMFDVVEHIEDDLSFLKSVFKFLEQDGLVYLTLPAFQFLWSDEDHDAGHFRRYTIQRAQYLLQKAGFTPIYSTYFFSPLVLPIFLFRSIPSRLGLKRESHDLKKYQKEHRQKGGILNSILNYFWKWELKRIKCRKRIPFGSSCLLVAKKK